MLHSLPCGAVILLILENTVQSIGSCNLAEFAKYRYSCIELKYRYSCIEILLITTCGYVFLSKCYPMCFIHCSALLSTAEKALYKFYITLHYKSMVHNIK